MKQLLLLPVLGLAACAGQRPAPAPASAAYPGDALPEDIREPGHVHTYQVNDYIDPNNPRLRHRGHAVDVVEQDEKWNLDPTSDESGGNYGPVATADDPNAAPNPYSAEFETELAQQRDQYKQLATLGEQMTAEMGKLEDMAEKEADAVSENASLRTRLEDLQREIDELKPPPSPPVAPNAPKKPSWWDSIFDLFRQLPKGTPVIEDKPDLHSNVVLRPISPPSATPASDILTTPPVTPTNAPGTTPSAPSIPSPGEMAGPHDDSLTQP
jgi:regulator of replication initiation timing